MPRASQAELRMLRQRADLVRIVSRQVKLRQNGQDWFGHCPFHDEKTPSFSVNPVKGFFHCFGCGAHGDVFDWFVRMEGIDFPSAVKRLQAELGGDRNEKEHFDAGTLNRRDESIRKLATGIWREAAPITGSLAETYLRSVRKISIELPDAVRFHPGLKDKPGSDGTHRPAMVVGIANPDGSIIAIQRTFLRADGLGKARIENAKRGLGKKENGAVRLAPAAATLGLAEGIETALSAMELYSLPVWCALGSALSKVWLPSNVKNVVIFADRGEAGERAADGASREFRAQGRRITIRFPAAGKDFNDELRARRDD